MVAAAPLGARRAYRARPTGPRLAKPRFSTSSQITAHPRLARWPLAATPRDAATRNSGATTLKTAPIAILLISSGSVRRWDHQRQKNSDRMIELEEPIASRVASQVTGTFIPKAVIWRFCSAQIR